MFNHAKTKPLIIACALLTTVSTSQYAQATSPAHLSESLTMSRSTSVSPMPRTTKSQSSTVELVFVLDTTGSMGGLLEGAKAKIWGIVNDIMQKRSKQGVQVKVGLVAYRDRGDDYLTKVTPLTDNLDEVYKQLMALRAEGGGDTPEDVRTAMKEALSKVRWSAPSPTNSQILFLVGDAPPHDDYQDLPSTTATAKLAYQRGILVNTIQCGSIGGTEAPWRAIAHYGGGEYFAIAQNGGVEVISTPYDAELAKLGEKIGATYLAYGQIEERENKQASQVRLEMSVSAAAPVVARAERAVNKAINHKAYDTADLVQQIESGNTTLAKLKEAELPESLQKLKAEERQAKIEQIIIERKGIRERILTVSKLRDQYLAEQSRQSDHTKSGFDSTVSSVLEKQIK